MKFYIVLILMWIMIAITSCQSSYEDCMYDCKNIYSEDFEYQVEKTMTPFYNDEPQVYNVTKIDYEARSLFCFELCRAG